MFFIILLGLISLLNYDKGAWVLYFDQLHSPNTDYFFKTITLLGEFTGFCLTFIVILLSVVPKKKFYLIMLSVSALITLGITQLCKHTIFKDEHRPSYYYEHLSLVDGTEQHKNNSFPSGHTGAAFTFATIIALIYEYRLLQYILPVLASLVAISRIYLGQHFLMDVLVGGILGIFIASISYMLISTHWSNK